MAAGRSAPIQASAWTPLFNPPAIRSQQNADTFEPVSDWVEACFTFDAENWVVEFDASCSTAQDAEITEWQWNFGDGNTSLAGPTVTHAYASPGTYNVTLRVRADNGLLSSPVDHDVTVDWALPLTRIDGGTTTVNIGPLLEGDVIIRMVAVHGSSPVPSAPSAWTTLHSSNLDSWVDLNADGIPQTAAFGFGCGIRVMATRVHTAAASLGFNVSNSVHQILVVLRGADSSVDVEDAVRFDSTTLRQTTLDNARTLDQTSATGWAGTSIAFGLFYASSVTGLLWDDDTTTLLLEQHSTGGSTMTGYLASGLGGTEGDVNGGTWPTWGGPVVGGRHWLINVRRSVDPAF